MVVLLSSGMLFGTPGMKLRTDIWKLYVAIASTTLEAPKSFITGSGAVVRFAESSTVLPRAIAAAIAPAVLSATYQRAASRAAPVRIFFVIQARLNSMIPTNRSRSNGSTRANSTRPCPLG